MSQVDEGKVADSDSLTRVRDPSTEAQGAPEKPVEWRPVKGMYRLAEVMMDPAAAQLTVEQKAELAKVSVRSAHRYLADGRFRDWVARLFRDGVFDRIAPILDAAQRVAVVPNKDGFNDRRMLLEMAGLVETTANLKHSGKVEVNPAQMVIIEMLPGSGDDEPGSAG